MSDDIVTRLRTALDEMELGCLGCSIINQNDHDSNCLTQEAADEIERLRIIIKNISNAVTDEGRKPNYRKQQANYIRTMWFPLWEAISKAVKETTNE